MTWYVAALLKLRAGLTWATDQGVPLAQAALDSIKAHLQKGRDKGWWDVDGTVQ